MKSPPVDPRVVWPSLPSRVELAGGWIRITRPKQIVHDTLNADWDSTRRVIRVQRSLVNAEAWKYLLHELVHAWLDDSRIFITVVPLTGDQEEAICEVMASGLHFRMRRELEAAQKVNT